MYRPAYKINKKITKKQIPAPDNPSSYFLHFLNIEVHFMIQITVAFRDLSFITVAFEKVYSPE